jgi:hypothetical protein
VEKRLSLRTDSSSLHVEYSFTNPGPETLDVWWASDWNLAVSGTELPERHYHADDHKTRHRLDETAQFDAVMNPIIADRWLQLWAEWHFPEPLAMWHVPINTLSQKEGGEVERTHQSSAFVFHRRLHLEPGETWSFAFEVEITAKRSL